MYQSERLIFRALQSDDAERLFEIYSDAEAMKYRQSTPHLTINDTFDMLNRDEEMRNSNKEIRFGVIQKDSNKLIGSVMFQPIKQKSIIGYSIAKDAWGNGYATEVVSWLIVHLKEKNFTVIDAWVMNENIASSKVLIKNGFKLVNQTIYPNSKYYQRYIS